jgi:hypothetical protein
MMDASSNFGDNMRSLRSYLAIFLTSMAMGVTAVSVTALTSASASAKEATAKKPKKAKSQRVSGVTFYEGSAETRIERERRLTRECRGRPNSGLCEGFARP